MNIIEKYDTWNDLEDENWAKMSKIQNKRYKAIGMKFGKDIYDSSGVSSSDPAASSGVSSGGYDKNRKYCERVHIKRDQINNVGNLIAFPLCPFDRDDKILIAGGLNIGLLTGKSHIFSAEKQKVNFQGELEMPIPDISKFYYKYRETKIYVVG